VFSPTHIERRTVEKVIATSPDFSYPGLDKRTASAVSFFGYAWGAVCLFCNRGGLNFLQAKVAMTTAAGEALPFAPGAKRNFATIKVEGVIGAHSLCEYICAILEDCL
jgi:hypothetical protein